MQKNNFILYTDYFEQLQMLTIEQRGVLLTALMCYQLGKQLPEMDKITAMCYSFISADVRRNNEKYEEIVEKRRESGRRGGKQTQANKANACFASDTNTNVRGSEANQANQANASDNVNVNVNVNENVNENANDNIPPIIPPQKKQTKHKYGEYNHVLLSDEDHQKLCSEFGDSLVQDAIRKVDEYCETSGKTYKNYNLVIRRWGIDRAREDSRGKANRVAQALQDSYNMMREWAEGG